MGDKETMGGPGRSCSNNHIFVVNTCGGEVHRLSPMFIGDPDQHVSYPGAATPHTSLSCRDAVLWHTSEGGWSGPRRTSRRRSWAPCFLMSRSWFLAGGLMDPQQSNLSPGPHFPPVPQSGDKLEGESSSVLAKARSMVNQVDPRLEVAGLIRASSGATSGCGWFDPRPTHREEMKKVNTYDDDDDAESCYRAAAMLTERLSGW